MIMEVDEKLEEHLIALRHELHRTPEQDLQLPRTKAILLRELRNLPLEIHLGEKSDSILAVLHGRAHGGCVLLRSDMDALPVEESSGDEFASTNGSMHACGHDMHMSGLVGAAELLSRRKEDFSGDIFFMFQPGEEYCAGAQVMIDEGLLEIDGVTPDAAYGLHVWSNETAGTFMTKSGTLMAGANNLRINVMGRGGHGSTPHESIDPVSAACEIILALQTFVAREVNVFDPVVITVSQIEAGTAFNAVPDRVKIGATVRNLTPDTWELMASRLPVLAQGIADGFRCRADVQFEVLYPPTINDEETTQEVASVLSTVFGKERLRILPNSRMGAEDFSFVLNKIPGTYMLLGARPDGLTRDEAFSNHSPKARFNDAVIKDAALALASIAIDKLQRLNVRD